MSTLGARGLRGANAELGDEDDRGRACLGQELRGPIPSNQNQARVLSAGWGGGGRGWNWNRAALRWGRTRRRRTEGRAQPLPEGPRVQICALGARAQEVLGGV